MRRDCKGAMSNTDTHAAFRSRNKHFDHEETETGSGTNPWELFRQSVEHISTKRENSLPVKRLGLCAVLKCKSTFGRCDTSRFKLKDG